MKKRILALLVLVLPLVVLTRDATAQGELFVSDFRGGTITRMNLDGSGATVIVAGLTAPEDGTCSEDGTLFFAENFVVNSTVFGRIFTFDRTGGGLTTVYDGSTSPVPFLRPEGLSFNDEGDLFFNTRSASDGAVWELAAASGIPVQATAIYTAFGEGTAFDADGNLLAVARAEGEIRKFSPPFSSTNTGTVFASGLAFAFGIAINSSGEVFVADEGTGTIQRFSSTGASLGTFVSGLTFPAFMEFDEDDNLYVVDNSAGQILKIAPDATITTIATALGSPVGLALCQEVDDDVDDDDADDDDEGDDDEGDDDDENLGKRSGEAAAAVLPNGYALFQNYPNPFNPSTVITYDLPEGNDVVLSVYNTLGQEVARLVEGYRAAGSYRVHFDAADLSAGVYVYILRAGELVSVKRMVLLK